LRVAVLVAFFLSGLSALIYEVVWMRMLTLAFGTTVFAVSTVVTVFMAGLAIGSYFFGRWVDKKAGELNTLKLYALLEGAIGLYCLFTPWAFSNLDILYGHIYRLAEINFYLFSLIRFLLSFTVLLIPTVLMGATLPVISKYFVTHRERVGRGIGALYGFNTFGAVLGVLITAFILIPFVGVKASLLTAVFLNLAIAFTMYYLASSTEEPFPASYLKETSQPKKKKKEYKAEAATGPGAVSLSFLVPAAFAASGFASLAYEVSWFRILSMTIGNTVYAFSVMLAIFLLGLALGSYLFSFFIDRIKDRLRAFAFMELLIGLSAVALIPLFGRLPLTFMGFVASFGFDFWAIQSVNFLTAFVAIIIPTLLMGATFPLVVRIITDDLGYLGRNVGSLYAVNTLGGVAGSFLAGFFFIPLIGVQTTIIFMVGINLAVGCALLFASPYASAVLKRVAAFSAIVLLIASFFLPSWDKTLLTSGIYVHAGWYLKYFERGDFLERLTEVNEIVYYDEGITGTTAVIKRPGNLILSVDGKAIADALVDPFGHTLLGSLPIILHPEPKKALHVGLGSGVTLGAMERFPVEEIETVEISPEVVEASQLFKEYNYNALEDERLKLIIDDGRTYLSYRDNRYDVIISQPSVPWMPGAANLYTREFYEIAKRGLKPGGIICQWIQSYRMDLEDVKTLIRTFQEVFPNTTLWTYELGSILLIGSMEPLVMPYDRIFETYNNPSIREMMEKIGVGTVEKFIGGFTMGEDMLKKFVAGAPLNTDNRPRIEFSAPRSIYKRTAVKNHNEIVRFLPFALPRVGGMVEEVDGITRVPFFKLEASLPDIWRLNYAGFSIKNDPFDEKAERRAYISKGVMTFVEWQRGGVERPGLPAEMEAYVKREFGERAEGVLRLRTEVHGTEKISEPELFILLLKTARGTRIDNGRAELNGHPFLWMINERQGTPVMTLTWHCPENGLRYIGTFSPAPEEKQALDKLLKEILSGFKCLHEL
jgi:spermidine synthase